MTEGAGTAVHTISSISKSASKSVNAILGRSPQLNCDLKCGFVAGEN